MNNSGLKTFSTMEITATATAAATETTTIIEHNNNKNIQNKNSNMAEAAPTELLKTPQHKGASLLKKYYRFIYTPDDILKPTRNTTAAPATTYANTSTSTSAKITKEQIYIVPTQGNGNINKQCLQAVDGAGGGSSKKDSTSAMSSSSKLRSAFIQITTPADLTATSAVPQEQYQLQQQQQRTEDQENAFRRIEDVHNYAKLQQCSYSNDGSTEEDDDDDDCEDIEAHKSVPPKSPPAPIPSQPLPIVARSTCKNAIDDSEEHVDVETVTKREEVELHVNLIDGARARMAEVQSNGPNATTGADNEMRPEHHARRPMNAFLIFCKRHRAIVKERYKSLENRAITKILGDWWAALDENEKQCFTDLAQQNKDAFFNANPNFKWYKLPAPPLRTLATRPSNANSSNIGHSNNNISGEDYAQQLQWIAGNPPQQGLMAAGMSAAAALPPNYFKLADETQMGELSALMSDNAGVQDKALALQQALSETTQFLSAHMPNSQAKSISSSYQKRTLLHDSASNSSEEDASFVSQCKKAKTTRSCKGKIYQELINSGQIAAIAKKSSKSAKIQQLDASGTPPISPPEHYHQLLDADGHSSPQSAHKQDRSTSECSSNGGIGMTPDFDLEEKIKELPALSLDAYLQRKRSSKKKKKFNPTKKQRNSNSSSNSSAVGNKRAGSTICATSFATVTGEERQQEAQQAAAAAAVGSQKRKARKESITRRNVSAIEQEVASILPLTINGTYYFNQTTSGAAPMRIQSSAATLGGAEATGAATAVAVPAENVSPPLSSSSASSSMSAYEQQFDVTSTSDLLILAEVAANRTELAN
ncbi:uncharacterized protein LOC115626652 [Scaptodrosophila lebanonensis]|uniref:Uncharacterized protein LOC115626652 n=1 Tax=Drosophila lebanonensis TaxID=7225 RepID=A0A6J2TSM0_DROLE|nr:uncharacterized protein LOC115626652 [Scaptodrosophila lebanonensis]